MWRKEKDNLLPIITIWSQSYNVPNLHLPKYHWINSHTWKRLHCDILLYKRNQIKGFSNSQGSELPRSAIYFQNTYRNFNIFSTQSFSFSVMIRIWSCQFFNINLLVSGCWDMTGICSKLKFDFRVSSQSLETGIERDIPWTHNKPTNQSKWKGLK